jgi:phage tail-like protein
MLLISIAKKEGAMPRRPEDPIGSYNFLVEIDGLEQTAFTSVTGILSETEVLLHRSGNERTGTVRKLPGLSKYGNVTLKRGYTANHDIYQWRKQVVDGLIERRSVSISILNENREAVARFYLENAWPCKWEISQFNADGNEVMIETVELAVERIELNK